MEVWRTGEFALVREIRRRLAARAASLAGADVRVGPGDDCAVVACRSGRELLLKTDEAVEGVHFDWRWVEARAVGRRAMAQNLSDIAAMAGEPRWALLALALPPAFEAERALEIVEGAAERAAEFGCALVGGNVTRAERVAVTIALVGDVEPGRAVLRSGARPGDGIFVTGEPGLARAGLLALAEGRAGHDAAAALGPAIARWRDPRPRIAEARFLRDRGGARAMIDLSDGLAGDLAHLASESGIGVRLDESALPVGRALEAAARALGQNARTLALEGGEDYELLFAAPDESALGARAELEARFGLSLARIGVATAGGRLEIAGEDGRVRPLAAQSYEHFRPAE